MYESQPTAPLDALMLLIQRVSEAQIEHGRTQARQSEDQHEIRLALAKLTTKLEPLTTLAPELAALRLDAQRHGDRLDVHAVELRWLRDAVSALQASSERRSGWETLGGKVLYVLGGAVAGLAVTAWMAYRSVA